MHSDVLLIESDPTLAKYLVDLIRTQTGCACHWVSTLADGVERLDTGSYWLIVVDLDLLDDRARRQIVALRTARPSLRIVGLDSLPDHHLNGAFDVIIQKPFVADPLLATLPTLRLQAIG